jgi:CBS domain-containing protein
LLHAGANGAARSRNEVRHDCGEIAIVESAENLKPIGVITDRDIAWRVVAAGKIPAQTSGAMLC